jgi:hypothetical protein
MPNNHVLLQKITLGASAASITFSNIPQSGYTDLKLVYSARTTTAGNDDEALISFNGSSSGFSQRNVYHTGSAAVSGTTPNQFAGSVNATGSTASVFSNIEVYIPNYTSNSQKSYSVDSVAENNATAIVMRLAAGLWSNTAAITSVTLTLGFAANSTFSLYGIAATGTTPTVAPKARGGNNITTDGTYWIHTFTSSGTFTPFAGLTCDYLVVAGGGGGGVNAAGGGGAGGYRTSIGGSSLSVSAQNYLITVGAGGAGSSTNSVSGNSGTNSTFSTITSSGGGGGGAASVGTAGGSGGGGGGGSSYAGGAGNTPSTSPSQGNNGGASVSAGGGGGGGGAGVVGQNASSSPISQKGGNGGNGSANTITGSSVTYAGGGGGAGGVNGGTDTAGAGGTGGGGTGKTAGIAATNGTTNLGGGGGGGWFNETAGSGGSGVVIIRYAV